MLNRQYLTSLEHNDRFKKKLYKFNPLGMDTYLYKEDRQFAFFKDIHGINTLKMEIITKEEKLNKEIHLIDGSD